MPVPPELIDAILQRFKPGARGPTISDVIGTPRSPSRRDVLRGGADLALNHGKKPHQMDDEEIGRELEYYLAQDYIGRNPSLWNEAEFGPMSEAYPEDLINAATKGEYFDNPKSLEELVRLAMERNLLR